MSESKKLRIDYSKAAGFVNKADLSAMSGRVEKAHDMLHGKTGQGNEFLGWLELPVNYDLEEFKRVLAAAETISQIPTYLL